MDLTWIPLKCVGPFNFGDQIDEYRNNFFLKLIPEEYNEKVDWDVYGITNDEIRIYVENGKIEAVSCEADWFYNGKNMIGMRIKDVLNLLRMEPDTVETEELVEGPQEVYDFGDLGLQLWVKNGVVVTAICSGLCDEEE